MDKEKNSFSEDMWSALEEELGEILSADEEIPGVYDIEADQGGQFSQAYYAVLDTSPIAGKVQNYGQKIEGLRVYARDDTSSGWHIVLYEVNKYMISARKKPFPEWIFRDISIHAMELYPEYFGTFPVPFHTIDGYTLRHWTLANGIYWLETSTCKELLAICYPIWNSDLSAAAAICGKEMEIDKKAETAKPGERRKTTPYLFFTKEFSCLPLYELMQTHSEWDGTIIDRPALMNAIWKYVPAYAIRSNGQPVPGKAFMLLNALEMSGLQIIPESDEKNSIRMFPDVGTDFLLLK